MHVPATPSAPSGVKPEMPDHVMQVNVMPLYLSLPVDQMVPPTLRNRTAGRDDKPVIHPAMRTAQTNADVYALPLSKLTRSTERGSSLRCIFGRLRLSPLSMVPLLRIQKRIGRCIVSPGKRAAERVFPGKMRRRHHPVFHVNASVDTEFDQRA